MIAMNNDQLMKKKHLLNYKVRPVIKWAKLYRVILGITLICSCQLLHAQQKTVTGKITDSTGGAVAGASVVVKGTKTGVSTDNNGNFLIKADENATIIVSTAGYETQTKSVAGTTTINFLLRSSNATLESVVVIGYQTVRKKDLTGAAGVVDMTDASKITSGSAAEAIQGLIPGVTVRNGGSPGSNAAIEIRGVGSFGNVAPLYVIDGMLSDANTTVNTDDIASIQVLKDASAAAIYGSRAGNGVIIITTKKGKEGNGQPAISLSAKYGAQTIPHKWDVMSAPQYLQTVKTQYANSGVNLPAEVTAQLASPTVN